MASFRLDVVDAPDAADLAWLETKLAEAAIAAMGVAEEQEFGVFVRDDDGNIRAGVAAIVLGGYCELQALWVDDALRGRGLARELMAEVETQARDRGCVLVMFHTYDVLVHGFHEKLGYQTVGVIDSDATCNAVRWYRKDL